MSDELHEREGLAAEYVLGSLDRATRLRVEQRLQTDAEIARLVDVWQQRLAPLAATVPPVAPPPQVWAGIERVLIEERAPLAPRQTHRGWSQSLAFWRWSTLGAGALAAALALYIALAPPGPPPGPPTRYVAVLNRGDASPALLVTVDPAAGRMTIRPLETARVEATPDEDRAMQLWLIAGTDMPPQALGLLDPAQEISLELDPEVEAVGPDAALAVSLEPPGGSPTGLPTGPVIYQGPLLTLAE
jgi:anti-sigma-K factor RskA